MGAVFHLIFGVKAGIYYRMCYIYDCTAGYQLISNIKLKPLPMSSEEKESTHHHHHRHGGRISIPQARKEILRWKAHIEALGDDCPYDFVQSFFIPMEDIKRLYENYQHLHPTGVRAYIGIKDKNEEGCAPLRLLLVPARKHTDFYNYGPHADDAVSDAGDSSVYDFTMPCPDVCAGDNGLNS